MPQLTRQNLWTLEEYARRRPAFRAEVIAHKKLRTLAIGPHVTLIFEDETTIRYQVQEMLRIEKTFEEDGILAELEAYNPLIPDGRNLKATMMIEYEDAAERARALQRLKGIEDRVWMRVAGFDPIYAVADEDMERENDTKTSAVHFLRFEFTPAMIAAFRTSAVSVGIDLPAYAIGIDPLPDDQRGALALDFAPG